MIALRPAQTRVYATGDAATEDAQRVGQSAAKLANRTSAAVTAIQGTPYGQGQLLAVPAAGGTTTTTLVFPGAGVLVFEHGLGRVPNGFVIVDATVGAPQLRRNVRAPALDAQSIEIQALGATTVKIWVW